MCGILGFAGLSLESIHTTNAIACQKHRGPDATGEKRIDRAYLGHNRLSIIDLSSDANQPMSDDSGRFWLVFNGEIYNYRELKRALSDYPFRTQSDSEVLLASYIKWGDDCLSHLIGMFAFSIWDDREKRLFLARDRFGVKPLHYVSTEGGLMFASEIRTLHEMGTEKKPDWSTWATYLNAGLTSHLAHTFWSGIQSLPAGHHLTWQDGTYHMTRWYDFEHAVGTETDARSDAEVEEEYLSLLEQSVAFRFRADVPLGVNLSGGLDSSILMALIQRVRGINDDTRAYTFVCGHPDYDELPWVEAMLAGSHHNLTPCLLRAEDVPTLHQMVSLHQSEPYGGLPTLAYQQIFKTASDSGCKVLLDGQGMDEQWAGYDYYRHTDLVQAPLIQGTRSKIVNEGCYQPDFLLQARTPNIAKPFSDPLRNLQFRDLFYTKLPRALRFNDRISMMHSVELREPFLDHRLVELAFRQPAHRKINELEGKLFLRRIAQHLIPEGVRTAPKRPLQTPQREWFRGALRDWIIAETDRAARRFPEVVHPSFRQHVDQYLMGHGDNSFFVWQLLSLAAIA